MDSKFSELRRIVEAMAEGPWFADEVTADGLTLVDTGRTADDAMFPFACETFEAAGIVVALRDRAIDLLDVCEAAEAYVERGDQPYTAGTAHELTTLYDALRTALEKWGKG